MAFQKYVVVVVRTVMCFFPARNRFPFLRLYFHSVPFRLVSVFPFVFYYDITYYICMHIISLPWPAVARVITKRKSSWTYGDGVKLLTTILLLWSLLVHAIVCAIHRNRRRGIIAEKNKSHSTCWPGHSIFFPRVFIWRVGNLVQRALPKRTTNDYAE